MHFTLHKGFQAEKNQKNDSADFKNRTLNGNYVCFGCKMIPNICIGTDTWHQFTVTAFLKSLFLKGFYLLII